MTPGLWKLVHEITNTPTILHQYNIIINTDMAMFSCKQDKLKLFKPQKGIITEYGVRNDEEDEDQNGDQFTYSSLNVVSYYFNYYSIF